MKTDDNKIKVIQSEPENKVQQLKDRQAILDFITSEADKNAKAYYEKREKEEFELQDGRKTSVFKEKESLKKILADIPQDHEPKFVDFFPALGILEKWSEATLKAYHKPRIAAKTINEVIYARFTKEVMEHIHFRNPYIKWCTRKYKNYKFLNEEGILLLEQYIYDSVKAMKESSSYYEYRVKMFNQHGVPYQTQFFL